MIDNNTIDNYVMIPNKVVQHNPKTDISSYIQLYGKRTVAYLKQLIELQNLREDIHFSFDMILWMLKIKKNLVRERNYFKVFISELYNNALINFSGEVDLEKLSSSAFVTAKLNIYEYKEIKPKENNTDTDNENKNNENNSVIAKQKVNYFKLMDSEYDLIMNKCSGGLDNYNLLNLFCNIKSRIKKNDIKSHASEKMPEVCYPSYETIKNDIFLESDKTLKQYIDALVELDLIHFGYAGDMIMHISGSKPIRRKSSFTYILSSPGWEEELETSIKSFRSKKRKEGWSFLSKQDEVSADGKRSITQKINMMQKKSKKTTLTQQEKKDLAKFKRQQEKWNNKYDTDVDIRKLEEDKLKSENPDKELSEIYDDMGYCAKAERALNEEEERDANVVVDFRPIVEIKGKGLQNKKSVVEVAVTVEDETDIYSDLFDEDEDFFSDNYGLTDEERASYQETENANYEQIPEDVLRHIQEQEYARSQWEDELREMQEENY